MTDSGTAEREGLSDGATVDDEFGPDPRQLSLEHFKRRVAEGAPRDYAAGEALNFLANAAMRGDKRVIVEG